MSEIYSWLLSIAGIILLGGIIDIVLPEGSIRKYIHGIFALAVMLVILLPLPDLINRDFGLSEYFDDTKINDGYLENIYRQKVRLVEQGLELGLSEEGYSGVKVTVITDGGTDDINIVQIIADRSGFKNSSGIPDSEVMKKIADILGEAAGIASSKVAVV